jgi:hypothetical protein
LFILKKASKPRIKIPEEANLSIQQGRDPAFSHLPQKGNRMKFTRRSFGKLAGTGILAASMPESACSNAEAKTTGYSFIPLTDIADHMNPCFPDQTPGFITSKPPTQQG